MQLTSRRFVSSLHSLNYDRSFTAKRWSLRHSKVLKLWRHVLFKTIFIGFTLYFWLRKYVNACPVATAVSLPALTTIRQKTRLTSVDLNLQNGVPGWNKTLSDVYSCSFRALSKYEKTIGSRVWTEAIQWSVTTHWRATKLYLLFEFLLKWLNLKAEGPETLFHIRRNLLCLLCRCVVSFLFALRCIFHCVRTWCVVRAALFGNSN